MCNNVIYALEKTTHIHTCTLSLAEVIFSITATSFPCSSVLVSEMVTLPSLDVSMKMNAFAGIVVLCSNVSTW